MFKAISILFFSISFTVHSYEIFQFNKDNVNEDAVENISK